jgi:hypothetical protein
MKPLKLSPKGQELIKLYESMGATGYERIKGDNGYSL